MWEEQSCLWFCKYFLFYMLKSCPEYIGDGLNFNNQRPAASLPTVYATSIYHFLIFNWFQTSSHCVRSPQQNLQNISGQLWFHKWFKWTDGLGDITFKTNMIPIMILLVDTNYSHFVCDCISFKHNSNTGYFSGGTWLRF